MSAPRYGPTTISPNARGQAATRPSNVAPVPARINSASVDVTDPTKLQRYLKLLREAMDTIASLANSNIFNSGVHQLSITLAAFTPTAIPHGLGRAYRGYVITKYSGFANVYDSALTDGRSTSTHINLTASAAVTIDILVF